MTLLSVIIPLIDSSSKGRFLKVATELSERSSLFEYPDEIRQTAFLLLQIKLYWSLGQVTTANNLIQENINNDEVRLLKIKYLIANNEYMQAEKLTQDKLRANKNSNYMYLQQWYDCLDIIYQATNQVQKRIYALQELLYSGDVNCYFKLKNILTTDGFWKDDYPEILNTISARLPYWDLAPILSEEYEIDRLFQLIKENTELFEKYGSKIYAKYPAETTSLFIENVEQLIVTSENRKHYRRIGKYILNYAKYGKNLLH